MRNVSAFILAAGLLFATATEANATSFTGSVSFATGSGPVFENTLYTTGTLSSQISANLSVNQSASFAFPVFYRADIQSSGRGSLTISFTNPVVDPVILIAQTSAIIIDAGIPGQCSGANCSLPPTSPNFSTLSVRYDALRFPCLCTDLTLSDGSRVEVSLALSPGMPGGGRTYALGNLTLTLLDLADPTPTEVSVPEPASFALLATALGVVAVRHRRHRAAAGRVAMRD